MTKLKVVSGWEGSKHTGEGGVVHAERDSQRLPLPRVQMAQKEGNVLEKVVSGTENSKVNQINCGQSVVFLIMSPCLVLIKMTFIYLDIFLASF